MKVKTSITISRETIALLDRLGGRQNRSRTIEEAVRAYWTQRARAARDDRDRAILDRVATRLNAEMTVALEHQGLP